MSTTITAPQQDSTTADAPITLNPKDLVVIEMIKNLNWEPYGPLDTRRVYFKPAYERDLHILEDAFTLTQGYVSLDANHNLLAFVLAQYIDDVPAYTDTMEFIHFCGGIDIELLARCEKIVRIGLNHWLHVSVADYQSQLKEARTVWASYVKQYGLAVV
jgi:hypothetical protein